MKKHLLCLTVDTDPDGLSGKVTNRRTLEWEGLKRLRQFPNQLESFADRLGRVPITWFIRADGQLESVLGTVFYLLETFGDFWKSLNKAGHELGWHPHLYRQKKPDDEPLLIIDPAEAEDELERLWSKLKTAFSPTAFRNGEGWHTANTFATVERLGFRCDSTAIPGRRGEPGHPMNWEGAPNKPYFPHPINICEPGPERALLELPMNSWCLRAPYDLAPRTRYMNPAVHGELFANALQAWENTLSVPATDLYVWVLIFHPDEVCSTRMPDLLYSTSCRTLCANLVSLVERLQELGHDFEWVTISDAAERWKKHAQRLST